MNYFLDPVCNVDIYDVPDRETYMRCAKNRAEFSFGMTIGIVVTILIIILWFSASMKTFIICTVVGLIVIAFSALNSYYWADLVAGKDYDAMQIKIDGMKDSGLSRSEAIDRLREETLDREQAQSRIEAARINAASRRSSSHTSTPGGLIDALLSRV